MTHLEREIEEILFAFQIAHPRPSPEDVRAFVERHPEHRAAIVEHAADLLGSAPDGQVDEERMNAALARGRSVAMDLLFRARDAQAEESGKSPSVSELLSSSGKTVPGLAREIDVGRGTLTDYVCGRIAPPIGRRLTRAVSGALGITVAAVERAYLVTMAAPIAARAKAEGTPIALRRRYDDVVGRDATMSDERRAFWLSED